MNLREKRYSTIDVPGFGEVRVKHITTKDYNAFRLAGESDPQSAVKALVQASLEIDDEAYDDIPMSILEPLTKSILEVNGLSKKQEEEAVKN